MCGELKRPSGRLAPREVLLRGTRRFLRSPVTWLLAVLGATWGIFFFCYPEVQLKVEQPDGWTAIWGASGVSTWLRCSIIIAITTIAPLSVLFVAFVVSEARRKL
jgi:hypothetical protein